MFPKLSKLIDKIKVNRLFIADEPSAPIIRTDIPGPNSKKMLESVSQFSQDYRTVKST